MIKNDRMTSLLLLVFCAFFYYQTYKIDTSDIVGINSAFFPRIILGLIALLTVIMLIRSFLSSPVRKERGKEKGTNIETKKGWSVGLVFALFSLYIFSIDIIGFILSSFLFMVGMYFIILKEKRSPKSHVFVFCGLLLTTILLSFFFEQYLDVYLPQGIFEDI
jgi:putative tricarboxylic transport membrane protein